MRHAAIALGAATEDPQALSIAAFVHAMVTHEYDSSIRALDRALEMNSNSALAFGFSSLVRSISERYEQAEEHARRALRLSPFDPLNYHPYLALAFCYLFNRRFEEAVANARLAVQVNPTFSVLHVGLVASLASLGDKEATQAAANRLLESLPGFTVDGIVRMAFLRPHVMEVFAGLLRQAGLPE